jgi:hypothetical protein
MALQNVAWALTGRGLMDCLQYYDNCLFRMSWAASCERCLCLVDHIFLLNLYMDGSVKRKLPSMTPCTRACNIFKFAVL